MKISGLQKLTLLDYPGHIACTIFTSGCNYRCPFCHNASLVIHTNNLPSIEETEVINFLKKRTGILQGVCITGGEPTLQTDLIPFIEKIKSMGFLVKLDTNGNNYEIVKKLISMNMIDYIAMDIKNSKEKYESTTGTRFFDVNEVEKSSALLLEGKIPYEFRTTLVKEYHTEEDLRSIGEWLRGADKYFLQAFQDSGDLIASNLHGFTEQELIYFRNLLVPYFKSVELRGVK